ncbi:DNA polymerase family B [Thermogladius calderae 1633]|uniref:DNA polymerase n=1 Tax=Thermogladius calderae (strain DSM 22663 / VKM B-2946 / 1633) TaxID=1184251 RepID=I3TCZ6_THEC1|nr:DNA polymerase II [Thermogladius calderae]AFK50634.1 DNA polymerase family B [Thermogladius calderae 1633]
MKIEFYMLDDTYEVVGNEPHVLIYGVTRDGRRVVLRDRRFRPYFYVVLSPDADPDTVAKKIKALSETSSPIIDVSVVDKKYFGRPVKALKVTTVIPESVRRYREKVKGVQGVAYVLEADIRFSLRYVLDHGLRPCGWHVAEVTEIPKKPGLRVDAEYEVTGPIESLEDSTPPRDLRILAFDIETYTKTGSPKPSQDPVIIIGVMNDKGELRSFTSDGLDDKKVIQEFVKYVQEYDPDIIVGYNSDAFDWPYLLERAKRVGVKLEVTRRLGVEPQTSTYGHVSIQGRLNVDLYRFAEEIPEIKVKSLDVVAEYLGVMKRSERTLVEYTDFPKYWDDPSKRGVLVKYNQDDVRSTMGLAEKFLPFAMQLSYVTRLPLDQVGAASVGNRLEWFLMYEAMKAGELIPNREEKEAEPYKGAVVLQPVRGIHDNVAVLDFSSMYPNLMIKYNVGPDTIERAGECDVGTHNIAPEVGHCFRREPPGFFKDVLTKLLELRKSIRSEMKKYKPDTVEYRILDERQRAIKILANATYGYMGWVGARWYCRECAEAVTAWGRATITNVIKYAEGLGLKVIYGDTDSIFVKYDKEKVDKLIKYVEEELGLEIKIDKLYTRVFFTEAKKRYAGLLEDGRVDIVGFEAVRGDWAEIAKEVQEEITEILLKDGDLNKAIEYVRSVVSQVKSGSVPVEKLVIWKTLTKRPEEYSAEAPHVSAARKLMKRGVRVDINDKIGYVVVKGAGKISDRAEPYIFVKDPKSVDDAYYVDHQIIPAAMRILEYFGVSEAQLKKTSQQAPSQKSLLDFLKQKKN